MSKILNIYHVALDFSNDLLDEIKYNFLGSSPPQFEVPRKIDITVHASSTLLWIESEEYPGLFASGSNPIELWDSLNDAIYSYFGVPRYLAKKLGNKFHLPLPDGTAIVERPKEEFARA